MPTVFLYRSIAIVLALMFFNSLASATDDVDKKHKIEVMYQEYKSSFKDLPEISATKAAERLHDGTAIIVDVRDEQEMKISTIAGSLNKRVFEAKMNLYKDRLIIAYCTIGYRSGIYATQLRKKGFNSSNLKAGILGWIFENQPLVDASGAQTKSVHVYGKKWNIVPNEYKSIW